MNSRRRSIRPGAVVRIVIASAIAGGLSATALAVAPAGAATEHAAKSVIVSTVKNAKLGTILVSGRTLYTLKPGKTACAASCHAIWPELTLPKGVTKATAGKGVTAAKLGTVERSNGVLQVTYGGAALYWFSGDKAAGQVNGNVTDTWGKWSTYVTVKPTGSGSGSGSNTGTGGAAF